MMPRHLVRVGRFGQVGRFASVDGTRFPRRARVLCRTARGTELGEVLAPDEGDGLELDGSVLRLVTVEDDLLVARLESRQSRAFESCQRLLRERNLPAVLMDVEHLFDGSSLYFYFLGEVSPELDELTSELAAAYETVVQFQQFSRTLAEGCGPACGTELAAGNACGTGNCSSCAIAQACGPKQASSHQLGGA